jgi:RNA polymerase sigma-70 factor (ECF subfamily)
MQLATAPAKRNLQALADEPLVRLASQGDESAIRILIQRHNRRLFRIARSVLRDDAEAEDVVQETYVRAFSNLGSFRGEARLSTWLTRIALNEALGRARRRRPTVELSDAEMREGRVLMFPPASTSTDPESETARSEFRRVLEDAVDALPEAFRVVFVLRDVEGMDTEETASQLSIRPETVKTRLHRARRTLRTAIERRLSATFSELFPFDGERCSHMADRVIERLLAGERPTTPR